MLPVGDSDLYQDAGFQLQCDVESGASPIVPPAQHLQYPKLTPVLADSSGIHALQRGGHITLLSCQVNAIHSDPLKQKDITKGHWFGIETKGTAFHVLPCNIHRRYNMKLPHDCS
jgi:hypothetical protein